MKEEFRRCPLDMEEPEVILSQAHTEPATLLAFLHENGNFFDAPFTTVIL